MTPHDWHMALPHWPRRRSGAGSSDRCPLQSEGMTMRLKTALLRAFLFPVDLLLRIIGPNYRLFYAFFAIAPPAFVAWLARLRTIRAVDHAVRRVPAYCAFL